MDEVLADLQRTRAAHEDAKDPARRADLSRTLDALRAEAKGIGGDPIEKLSDERLEQRIAHCTDRLDSLAETRLHIGHVGPGGGGSGGGLDARQTMEHNAMVDQQGGRAEIERELAALVGELGRRRASS